MFFVHPHLLWLLILLLPLAALHARHRMGLRPAPAAAVSVVRLLALALLVLAMASPVVQREDRTQVEVVVADVSASTVDEVLDAAGDSLAIGPSEGFQQRFVVFDSAAREVPLTTEPSNPGALAKLRAESGASRGSAMADALDLASALIPRDGGGRVLLFSDGLETAGDARAAAWRLGGRGIELTVRDAGPPRSGEAVLRSVSLPASAAVGATVTLEALVESSQATEAQLVVRNATVGLETVIPLQLTGGVQEIRGELRLTAEGLEQFAVTLEAQSDVLPDNNELPAAVRVLEPRLVKVVEDGSVATARALAAMLGPAGRVLPLDPSAVEVGAIADADLLVLADVPANQLPPGAPQAIRAAVESGTGLLVTGGRRSFGPGGYVETALAEILPVSLSQKVERRDPSATVVVIIDTSGSMGGPRVNLAKEIARLALRRLKPHDKAGIVEFYGSKRWAAPIQPASNAIDLQRALNRLTAGGGTVILPAIEEAYYALLNVRTRTRHVLVLTDGGVETGAFEPLIRKMADHGMTVSTVLVGPGAHSAFLARLAQWGRGKFYSAPNRFNLPEIIVKQPESSLLSPFVEQETLLLPAADLPALEDIDFAAAPTLGGYVESQSRPTADVLVESELGHPILARWQFGLGRVGVLTTHLSGDWSADLARWPGYGKLVSSTARWLCGTPPEEALVLEPRVRPAGLELDITAGAEANVPAFAAVRLTVRDAAGGVRSQQVLDPVSPGKWNVLLTDLSPGTYSLEADAGIAGGKAAVVVPPAREVSRVGPDLGLLGDLERLSRREVASSVAPGPAASLELWPWLAAGALVAMLLQVLIRRWPWGVGLRELALVAILLTGWTSAARADLTQAAEARSRGDLAGAQEALRQSVSEEDSAEAWARLASVAELLGDTDEALKAIDHALARTPDAALRFSLLARKAQLLWDAGESEAARAAGSELDEGGPVGRYVAVLAGLCGDSSFAADRLTPAGEGKDRLHEHLFRGLFLLRSGRAASAQGEFEQSLEYAGLARDRRYVLERIVTAARQAGQLPELADRWLAEEKLTPEQMKALVAVLGELNRSDDALSLLRRHPATEKQQRWLESGELQRDVIAVAIDAGQSAEAESAYRALVEQHPEEAQYRLSLARLLLLEGRRKEATGVLKQGIAASQRSSDLMALAEGARNLALDEVAEAAARKAAQNGSASRVRSALFLADVARQRGRPEQAVRILGGLRELARNDPEVLLPLAEGFERYGDRAEALRLLSLLYERTRSEDTLLRIAWLTEESGRFDEAMGLWKRLWEKTQVQARRNQAQVRLLDLASRTGGLADLAIELEEKLDAGAGGEKELSLLVDIYSGANDPVAASEILYEFGRRSGDQVDMLQRLARVYLDGEQFGRCNAILRRLVELDPDDAEDYLQQIAIIALERQQPIQAREALAELEELQSGQRTDEFAAGVLDMIGLHEEAAAAYEEVLEEYPDRIEVFLLWGNAMKAAGMQERAIGRFQVLTESAAEDDLFTVAIDGLLNLEAPPMVLASALRRVRERIALKPDKVYLYRLAADLLDAMNRPGDERAVLEQGVVVAGERRGPMLRELMDSANGDGLTEETIRFGRSLLALGDEVPPQALLDLGQALVGAGDLATANRVFRRAAMLGEFAQVQRRVARYYEQADMPDRAERILRELLITEPDNVELLIGSGGLCEQMGRFERAFEQYYQAAEIMLRRLPTVIRAGEAPAAASVATPGTRVVRRAMNLDEMTQYFQSAGSGLLSATRTSELRTRLLADLRGRIETELSSLESSGSLASELRLNPRLQSLVRFLRYVAFAMHVPDVADEMDRKVLDRYPQDETARPEMLRDRLAWGLYRRAESLAEAAGAFPLAVQVERVLADAASLEKALGAEKLDTNLARALLPRLVMTGRDEPARRLLNRLLTESASPADGVAESIFAAAVALEDSAAVRAWARKSLDACRGDARAGAAATRVVRLAWNSLDAAGRAALLDQLSRVAESVPGSQRVEIDLAQLALAKGSGLAVDGADQILRSAAADADRRPGPLADLLREAEPEDREGLLRIAVGARREADRREFLLELAGAVRFEPSEALTAAFGELFRSAPALRLRADRAYSALQRTGAARNPYAAPLVLAMAEAMLAESPDDSTRIVFAALARHGAGQPDGASLLAAEALEAIASRSELSYSDQRMLADIASILSAEALETAIDDLAFRLEFEGATQTLLVARGILLEAAGREAEALESYQEAYRLAPNEFDASRRMISAMERSGRRVQLAELLSANLTRSTIMQSFQWRTLTDLYIGLHRPQQALEAARKNDSPLGPVGIIHISHITGNDDRALIVLRRFLVRNRNERRFYSPFWPDPPVVGGMKEFLQNPDGRNPDRMRLYEALAPASFASTEFPALLRAATPGRKDAPGIALGVVRAAEIRGEVEGLAAELLEAWRQRAMNDKDRLLLLGLGIRRPGLVPEALLPAVEQSLLYADPENIDDLDALTRILLAHGQTRRAQSVLRWMVAREMLANRGAYLRGERLERIDLLASTYGPEGEAARRRRWLDLLFPTPLDSPGDRLDAALLERWSRLEDGPALQRRVEQFRRLAMREDPSRCRRLLAALAQADAAAGRFERFREMIQRLLSDYAEGLTSLPFDWRRPLGDADRMDEPERYVRTYVEEILAYGGDGPEPQERRLSALCLVGQWCCENGLMDQAREVLTRAEAAVDDPNGRWLWVSDLAEAAGQADKALNIRLELLARRMLPIPRAAAVLDAVERKDGAARADALAAEMAAYSDLPAILVRAIRHARTHGEPAKAESLRARLARAGGVPAGK